MRLARYLMIGEMALIAMGQHDSWAVADLPKDGKIQEDPGFQGSNVSYVNKKQQLWDINSAFNDREMPLIVANADAQQIANDPPKIDGPLEDKGNRINLKDIKGINGDTLIQQLKSGTKTILLGDGSEIGFTHPKAIVTIEEVKRYKKYSVFGQEQGVEKLVFTIEIPYAFSVDANDSDTKPPTETSEELKDYHMKVFYRTINVTLQFDKEGTIKFQKISESRLSANEKDQSYYIEVKLEKMIKYKKDGTVSTLRATKLKAEYLPMHYFRFSIQLRLQRIKDLENEGLLSPNRVFNR